MKAISLWQPWASLWLSPRKVHETRHWPIRHRGWLAVHAAKTVEQGDMYLHAICCEEFGQLWYNTLPRGALVGAVHVEGCYHAEDVRRCALASHPQGSARREPDDILCGNFASGRFAWARGSFWRLPEPVPMRGRQGLFDVPDEHFAGLLAPRGTHADLVIPDDVQFGIDLAAEEATN